MASVIAKTERVAEMIELLKKLYPDAECSLNYSNPLELTIATILSAQCTDERVNEVTKALLKRYKTAQEYAEAEREELENLIKPTGFFRNKAKAIQNVCQQILTQHQGNVPQTMKALTQMSGIGRKTANVILGNAFGIAAGVVVDTHVTRLSQRLGLTKLTKAEKIEEQLMDLIPQNEWILFPHLIISHGREICKARKPLCAKCALHTICPSSSV